MKINLIQLTEQIFQGKKLSKDEALLLWEENVQELSKNADRIRRCFCSDRFDFCSIVNAKSGKCPENCRYCAQSAFYPVPTEEYPLRNSDFLTADAQAHFQLGIPRYSFVTSGRALSETDLTALCRTIRKIKESGNSPSLCGSLGLLERPQLQALKEAGLSRFHCNLETSRAFFPMICSTHTFDDKIRTLETARDVGLELCSGGIIGLGESPEDRIDLALELRRLKIPSIPINVLHPIPGTPLEKRPILSSDEVQKTVAIFRFILPNADLRMAGGRGLFADRGRLFFSSGANAAITGNMLTTSGISVQEDLEIIRECGFSANLTN